MGALLTLCSKTPDHRLQWTEEEVTEFQMMWGSMVEKFRPNVSAMGISLLSWMLDEIPGMEQRFRHFHVERLDSGRYSYDMRFIEHANAFTLQLGRLIAGLSTPDAIDRKLKYLARFHLSLDPPIAVTDFEIFRDQFHIFLKKATKSNPSQREREMWYEFLDMMVKHYRKEYEKIHPARSRSPSLSKEKEENSKKSSKSSDKNIVIEPTTTTETVEVEEQEEDVVVETVTIPLENESNHRDS